MNEMQPLQSAAVGRLADTGDPSSLSTKFRQKRDVKLRELITAISATGGELRILDLGGSVEYWRRVGLDFLRESGATVTVMNITATELKADAADARLFTAVVGDACDLSGMEDGSFDLVHSNSVIEHVGDWALRCSSRMARNGRSTRRIWFRTTGPRWSPRRWRRWSGRCAPASRPSRCRSARRSRPRANRRSRIRPACPS